MATWQNKLENLSSQIKGVSPYHQMLQALIEEMQEKTVAMIGEEKNAKPYQKQLRKEWEAYLGEFIDLVEAWLVVDFEMIKKRKDYEEMEALMADLDDWLDEANEQLEADQLQLGYMEAWDIGIFLS